jgi:hypothetical protein
MRLKIGPGGKIGVTCEGMTQKELLEDLQTAVEFIESSINFKSDQEVQKTKTMEDLSNE